MGRKNRAVESPSSALEVNERFFKMRCLTKRQVFLKGMRKTKVKYAMKTLSHITAAHLQTVAMSNDSRVIIAGAMETAAAIEDFDKMIDDVNGPSKLKDKPRRRNVSKESGHL